MPIQTYNLTPSRVGVLLGRIIKHAMPKIVLGTVGINDDFKRNKGDTVRYRRFLQKGSTAAQPNRFFQDGTGDRATQYAIDHLTSDGITSNAETISVQDISAQLNQYNILYGYTDRTFDLYEDDIPKAMTELVGERSGLVCEMALFGVLKAGTNKMYAGGTTRGTVSSVLTLNILRRALRSLRANHAETISTMLRRVPAGGFGTAPVGICFPTFLSTDLIPDLRELPGFTPVEEYGNPSEAVENEVGKCESFRFIASPELVEIQDAGAAVAGAVPPLKSTSGTSADVYQVIVGSKDAWGHIGLNMDKESVTALPPGVRDKADPQGQRGYVGTKFYYNAVILNNLQMVVIECATRSLA